MRAALLAAGLTALNIFASAAAAECTRTMPARAETTLIPDRAIDQNLLDAAVRQEVNFHRCRAGLRGLKAAGKRVEKMAEGHATWMASTQMLSHRSTLPGRVSLRDRFARSGVSYQSGAENLGMVHRYQIDNRRFKILDASTCKFADSQGNALGPHSYGSLAREIVQLWMESPKHRENVLHRDLREVATAAVADGRSGYCGRLWVAQNFVG